MQVFSKYFETAGSMSRCLFEINTQIKDNQHQGGLQKTHSECNSKPWSQTYLNQHTDFIFSNFLKDSTSMFGFLPATELSHPYCASVTGRSRLSSLDQK